MGKVVLLNRRQTIKRDSVKSCWQPTLSTAEGTGASVLEGPLVMHSQYRCTQIPKPSGQEGTRPKNRAFQSIPQLRDTQSSHVNISEIRMHFAIHVKGGLPTLPHPAYSKAVIKLMVDIRV